MRGMERHDDREIGRWRHVAFDDGDGSIQMAVDANTPDERHLDGWIGARHRFALACETADPAAMRDALDAVRDRATRDHIFEESLNASHGGAGYHTPFSESWRLLDILDLALDPFVPRDDELLWMGLPCMGWEDGEATEGAIADPTDLTVAADGSPIPVDPDPADRLCGMAAARAARLLEDDADRIIRITDTANGMRFGNMDALIRADRMRAQTRAAIRWGLWGMIPDILDDARRLIPAEPRAVDRWRSLAHIAGDSGYRVGLMLDRMDARRQGEEADGLLDGEADRILDLLADEDIIDRGLAEDIRERGSEALR